MKNRDYLITIHNKDRYKAPELIRLSQVSKDYYTGYLDSLIESKGEQRIESSVV